MVTKDRGSYKACLLFDPVYLNHDTGDYHPEMPMRIQAIVDGLKKTDIYPQLLQIPALTADTDTVALVHHSHYIKLVEDECNRGFYSLSTGDTNISQQSYEVALKAVGGLLSVVDRVMDKTVNKGFCVLRPPGHHANQGRGMGFCIFNNVAIAARYCQKKYGLEKVLIVDWDVHHGNGTQDIFYDDNSVFFMSTHQYPWYPGTGSVYEVGQGKGKGYTLNRPFQAGAGDEEIINVFLNDFMPAAKAFKPDIIFISAGFDSRINDPLGGFLITDNGFSRLTQLVKEMADNAGHKRVISILEGGYNLEGLPLASRAHVEALIK